MTSPLLKVNHLNVHYGVIHAVKDLTFEVFPGEIVSLIGANGAGKTTTLKAISGLLPFTGSVQYQNTEMNGMRPHEIVKLGLVHSPEGRGVFPNLTVLENLEMGAYTRRDSIERDLEQAYRLFPRLKERIKQLAGTLSGGEQQMLAMARALMSRPQILMLDEPSLGLAPRIVSQIFEIIQQVNSTGMTVLLVEQNAHQALKISHRGYVLETGSIKLSGVGRELAANDDVRKSYLGG